MDMAPVVVLLRRPVEPFVSVDDCCLSLFVAAGPMAATELASLVLVCAD